jgi:hypothetical protein
MLVCNISLRPPRRLIAADLAEAAAAVDASTTGNVVFATLVDDPASVRETVDAYTGSIMLEAASAAATVSVGLVYSTVVNAVTTAGAVTDASIVAAGVPPPLDGLSGVSGAWSVGRKLLTAYTANSGAFYHLTSSAVDTWYDQSGNARDFSQFTSTSRPTITTAGANNSAALLCAGASYLDNVALSNFITASDGYVVAALIADRTSSNVAAVYSNDAPFGDASAYMSANIQAGSIYAYNYHAGVTSVGIPISTATTYIVEWLHTGGNLSLRVNGGTPQTVASGTTDALTGIFRAGAGSATFLYGKLFELIAFSTVPASGTRDALVANMKSYYGA